MRPEDKQKLLEENSLAVKLDAVAMALSREIEVLELKGQIQSKAEKEMTDAQRQYMLRQQLKAIQAELGEGEGEAQEIRQAGDRRAAAGAGGGGGAARGRPARADDAGVARVPDDPHLSRLGARRPVGQDDRGSPGSGRSAARARRGPLRSRQGQGADRRVPGGAEAAAVASATTRRRRRVGPGPARRDRRAGRRERRADEGADPLLRRPARRRQDLARPVDCPRDEPEVRPDLARRRPRRGGNPRPPPHLHRLDAGPARAGAEDRRLGRTPC